MKKTQLGTLIILWKKTAGYRGAYIWKQPMFKPHFSTHSHFVIEYLDPVLQMLPNDFPDLFQTNNILHLKNIHQPII